MMSMLFSYLIIQTYFLHTYSILPRNESHLGFPPVELEDTQEAFFFWSVQTARTGANKV